MNRVTIKKMIKKTKTAKFLYKMRSFFPETLPQSVWEFDAFMEKICFVYGFPTTDSYVQAVATMIMHLSPTTDTKPMRFFAKAIRKSSSNNVAYYQIENIRKLEKQKALDEELKLKSNPSSDSIPNGVTESGKTIKITTPSC